MIRYVESSQWNPNRTRKFFWRPRRTLYISGAQKVTFFFKRHRRCLMILSDLGWENFIFIAYISAHKDGNLNILSLNSPHQPAQEFTNAQDSDSGTWMTAVAGQCFIKAQLIIMIQRSSKKNVYTYYEDCAWWSKALLKAQINLRVG